LPKSCKGKGGRRDPCRAGHSLNNLCDVTGDALGNRIGGLMRIFDKRSLHADKTINPINVKERIA
jgi:hypothetical protein